MHLLCLARLHRPTPDRVWNAGHYFARCRRCQADLIRRLHGPWQPVPKGFRVVWRAKPADHPDWNNFAAPDAAAPPPEAQPPRPEGAYMRRVGSEAAASGAAPGSPPFREWRARSVAGGSVF
jgi:hypothetical protein